MESPYIIQRKFLKMTEWNLGTPLYKLTMTDRHTHRPTDKKNTYRGREISSCYSKNVKEKVFNIFTF